MTLAGRRPRNIFDEYARRRLAEQAEEARRNGGPRPYRADEAGHTECPNCDLGAFGDSVCCPYCAAKMPSPGHYVQDPLDVVTCPSCLSGNRPISTFCDQCGSSLPPSAFESADARKLAAVGSSGRQPGQPGDRAYVGVPNVLPPGSADQCGTCGHRASHCPHRNSDCPHCGNKVNAAALAAAAGHPMSSSGRQPVAPSQRTAFLAERSATMDQQARRADLLSGYRPGDGDPLIFELGRAERLVRSAESDLEYAQQFARDAKADFPGDVETARGRYLDPDATDRYAHYCAAEAGVAAALAALQAAKRLQSELLAEYDDISRAFQLGRIPDVI